MGDLPPELLWIALPVLIAGASALVTALVMQARAEVAVSRHRETLAEARALLATQHRAMEERVRATEETARRKALDEFLESIQTEERQFLREIPSWFSKRRALVVQQRVCFRNVPLTNWVEQEFPGATELVRIPLRTPEPVPDVAGLLGPPISPSTASAPPPAAETRRIAAGSGAAAGRW